MTTSGYIVLGAALLFGVTRYSQQDAPAPTGVMTQHASGPADHAKEPKPAKVATPRQVDKQKAKAAKKIAKADKANQSHPM